MRNIPRWYLAFSIIAMVIVSLLYGRTEYKEGYAAGYDYIKSIAELQEQVGAKPDGIWGQETTRLYKRAYYDQEAVKMFERMSEE